MKKHTGSEYLKLWFSNWRYRRLLPVSWARSPLDRAADWLDVPFVSFSCLSIVLDALRHKEHIPATIILIGSPFSMKEWDKIIERTRELAEEYKW